ncbi:uncharacterized protein LOC130667708 isoform X2 [Microplitis mediator]|uniref:uncharacterized protein LOC130667708 isoform X2 n=1 Tax=Microplitis mediator TaxID=375433 RepID=UPI0025568645|nr:uncharacterized protein LOC130667708 isoform X2 [Microplitis mediator]
MVLLNYYILPIISLVAIYLTFCESATIKTEKEFINGFELSNKTNSQNSNELRTCNYDMPCAWYIYQINPLFGFDKIFKSFLLNKCKCKDDTYRCIRTWEKLSAQAYVYNCRQNATKYDIYAPDHDIFSQDIDPYAYDITP